MSRRKIKAGTTSLMVPLFIQDTQSTTGQGLSGLVYNTSGLGAQYRRAGTSGWTTVTLANATPGTYVSGGFVADGGPVAGGYEIGIPNAALATGAEWVEVIYYGAANMLPVLLEFELDALDYQDGIRGGLAALPAASANANGGLPILSNSGTRLNYSVATVEQVTGLAGGVITAASIANDALTAAKFAADVTTELQNGLATASAMSVLDGRAIAIQARTDLIPNAPAETSDVTAAVAVLQGDFGTLTGYVDTEIAAIKSTTDQLATMLEVDGGGYRFTANALEQAAGGSGGTVYVYPLAATVPTPTLISTGITQAFQHTPLPAGPLALFDSDQQPINLQGAVLQMILTRTTEPTDIVILSTNTGELHVGGTNFNQVTIDYTPAFFGEYEWKLYRQEAAPEDWTVLAIGFWNIEAGEDPA